MNYKLIASDLDETLLSTDRHVCKRNIEAIKKAEEAGVRFVCATGRPFDSIEPTLKEIGQHQKPGEYAISFNGGAVTENGTNRVLHFEGLDFETADRIFKRGLQYDCCIHVYTLSKVFALRLTDNERNYLHNRLDVTEFDEENIDFLKEEPIVKLLFVNTDYSELRRMEREMEDITGNLDVSFSSNRYIEFNKKGVNKGSGLLWLANYLGIKPEETIAIGDNFNDLSMIQAAGLGAGVANTIEDMKELCDLITEADCDEGGVAEVIENFVLNKKEEA